MSSYDLIAFDMDGTLLNSRKEFLPSSLDAIERAANAGKTVILSTGRCIPELLPLLPSLPTVRYLDCISGALVWDCAKQEAVYRNPLAPETVLELLSVIRGRDVMIHMLCETVSLVQRSHCRNMARYGMGIYQKSFQKITRQWDDIAGQYKADPFPVSKFNLYCAGQDIREQIYRQVLAAGIPVTPAYAEAASLEFTAAGVSKAVGLRKLCDHLNIPLSRTIAVGDAGNDAEILRAAGLAVAMGNSTSEILQLADVVVADCDHGGCAEAIDRFLLGPSETKAQ